MTRPAAPRNGRTFPSPPIPEKPSDLPTAASLVRPEMQTTHIPESAISSSGAKADKIPVSTQGLYRGRLFTVTIDAALSPATLDRLCDRLDALGLEPLPLPIARDADGHPICPKHHVSMRPREKQGDTWHSHQVGVSGQEVFCKGRPGADSPGWDVP